MFLYGASGHAKVIIDIIRANHERIDGLFDDNEDISELWGYPVLHTLPSKGPLIVSIGDNRIRKKIADRLKISFGQAVHPSAIISDTVSLQAGTVVMHGAIIQPEVRIGRHCIINTGASIDHECIIGDYVHISPHCTLCGNVSVGEGSWIGAGSTIIPGVNIGKWSVIGAGSVVTSDIPDHVLAYGNRCRIKKSL